MKLNLLWVFLLLLQCTVLMLSWECLKDSKISRCLQLVTSIPKQNALGCIESFSWPPKCNQLHQRKNETKFLTNFLLCSGLLFPLIDFDYLHFLEFCRQSSPTSARFKVIYTLSFCFFFCCCSLATFFRLFEVPSHSTVKRRRIYWSKEICCWLFFIWKSSS